MKILSLRNYNYIALLEKLGTPSSVSGLGLGEKLMPRTNIAAQWTELTLEERRERRRLRREKQREDNVRRAAKMHFTRLKRRAATSQAPSDFKQSIHVGCSGWRY
jgi:hypothetical protein